MTGILSGAAAAGTGRALPRRSLLMWSAATLALAGCADVLYEAPTADVAGRFDSDAPVRSSDPAAREWWRSFRDPELDRLMAAGIARNLDVQQAVAEISMAQAAAQSVGANDLPQVNGSATAARGDTQGTGTNESSSVGLGASWVLDVFGANRNARNAASAQLDAAYLSADVARLVMESGIASAYVDLRYYQASIALTKRSLSSRRQSLDLTRTQFELGEASRLDVLQADQLVAEGDAQMPGYEVGYEQALARLATLTAQRKTDLRPRLQKSGSQLRPRFKANVGVPADVVRNRPDVRLAERNYAAAAYNVGVAKAQFFPSVSLSGSVTPTNLNRGGSITYWTLGPQIDLPIFRGGANVANLKSAEASAVKAKLGWESAVLNAIEDVESALAAYNRDARNIAAQQRLVNTAAETVDLSRTNFSLGEGTFMTVLDAERSSLSAQQSLASAERQRATDFISLSVAAAGGTQ